MAPALKVSTSSTSPLLAAAVSRYAAIFDAHLKQPDAATSAHRRPGGPAARDGAVALQAVAVAVKSDDEALGPHTDYSYAVSVQADSPEATVTAATVFGAMAGLETLSQLFDPNTTATLVVTACDITDAPAYDHRGLLVDSGRRFLPVPLLEDLLNSMSYSKLNVLHLHLSDWAAERLAVDAYPQLTAGLGTQFYSKDDAAHLLQFAAERGIRIVPEIDVPAHSAAFVPLKPLGVEFCDDSNTLLYNNPANNNTLDIVSKVFAEVAAAFPDAVFHLGGDETVPTGKCTYDDIHRLERGLQAAVTALGKQPAVWNEVFSNPPATVPNGARPGTMIQNWHDNGSGSTTKAGFESLVSTYNQLYLDQECCAAGGNSVDPGDRVKQCYYFDISGGVAAGDMHLLKGGETAMWTDMYCAPPHCPQTGPWAKWYAPEHDAVFSESFANLIWPRAAGAAGSFWRFDATLTTASARYTETLANHNARLAARGSTTCPNYCGCSWNNKCGQPYDGTQPTLPMRTTLINTDKVKLSVKQATPCTGGAGDLIKQLSPGERVTVTEDFIVVTNKAEGDPFSAWWGGPGWRQCNFTYNLKISGTYIEYVQTTV